MNKGQALAAVYGNPGKRYRDKSWGESEYIYVDPETGILCSDNGPTWSNETFLSNFFEAGLNNGEWEEWTKLKVIANGLAELFAKSDGKKRFWVGEDKVCYFVGGAGHLKVYDYPDYPFQIDQDFLRQKFTLLEKEDKS